jgi:uncharacterized protein YjlB
MNDKNTRKFLLQDDGTFPNHPRWPLLIYRGAVQLPSGDPASELERIFSQNGWGGMWRNGIYSFAHYHSNAHEALGVYRGSAHVQFGGPNGVKVALQAGDVAVLPAGTAHQNLGSSGDLGVVGAYPPGPAYDLCRGKREERSQAIETIKGVPRPDADPVFGKQAGLCTCWSE